MNVPYYVFRIRQISTGKCYISSNRDVPLRWRQMRMPSGLVQGNPLACAMRESGIEDFICEVLAEFDNEKDAKDTAFLMQYRDKTIFPDGFNPRTAKFVAAETHRSSDKIVDLREDQSSPIQTSVPTYLP